MPVSLDPALCTEEANPNYTAGTFRLYVTPEGEAEQDIGNIMTGSFQFTPNILDHRRGIDNSLDFRMLLGTDYLINFTADEITVGNLAIALNETPIPTASGCRIPLTGSRCVREYGARLVHAWPCAEKTMTLYIWRASILADWTLAFDAGAFASYANTITALYCGSRFPNEAYGRVEIDEPCPWS